MGGGQGASEEHASGVSSRCKRKLRAGTSKPAGPCTIRLNLQERCAGLAHRACPAVHSNARVAARVLAVLACICGQRASSIGMVTWRQNDPAVCAQQHTLQQGNKGSSRNRQRGGDDKLATAGTAPESSCGGSDSLPLLPSPSSASSSPSSPPSLSSPLLMSTSCTAPRRRFLGSLRSIRE